MVLTLSEIFDLLCIIDYYHSETPTLKIVIKNSFNEKPLVNSNTSDYDEVEKYCKKLNLIEIKNEKIFLSTLGKKFIENYNKFRLTENFKNFFIYDILFNSEIINDLRKILSNFQIDENESRWISKNKIVDLFGDDSSFLYVLNEIDLLQRRNSIFEINGKHNKIIFHNPKKMTPKQLDIKLQNQKIIGQIAEEIVMEYEKNRLKNEGFDELSKLVCQVSCENVLLGFDIESFEKYDENMSKIFIEVKGTNEKNLDFYISDNEKEKAKELGEKYWIYFVPEIDSKTRSSPVMPIRIKNAYKEIFQGNMFNIKNKIFHITKESK